MEPTSSKLVVRLNVTNDFMQSWKAGKAAHMDGQALQQAERAAKVRYMGYKSVQVEPLEAEESWFCENGQVRLSIDFTFQVTAA